MSIKLLDIIKKRSVFIVAFFIPMIVLGGILIGKEIIPWGDNMYLRSDMYHQYAPFYKELYNKLTSGESLTYSWNIGMGVNFTAIYAYYLASPINLLIGILPEGIIPHTMDFLIVFKTSLAGLSFAYYLSKHFKTKNASIAAISVFYALSSYMAAFSWNIMWLDCIVLLPLIVLGLEKLVYEGKFKLYTIALGIAIFSNYYIAIMICIFLVLYFIVILLTNPNKRPPHYYVNRIIKFGLFSAVAGGLGAIMFIPEMYALSYTVSGDFTFPEVWANYFSIMDMLSRSLMDVKVAIFEAHEPNIYSTVAVFLMVPLYCVSSKINYREKVGKILLLIIFLLSFNTNIPNYIWHGFHFPNSLPARESFIYIFLILVVSYEAVINIKSLTRKQIYATFAGAVGIILLLEKTYVDDTYSFEIIYLSLAFLTFYLALTLIYHSGKIKTGFIIYLLFVVCIAEAAINSNHEDSYKTIGYSPYVEDNEALDTLIRKVSEQDTDFYRIEKLTRRTKNDAAWSDYKGVSIFSSMTNGSFTDYLGALGFEKSTNAYSYYGNTPFTSALLDVKYVFSNSFLENTPYMTLFDSAEFNDYYNETNATYNRYLYEMKYSLPLGFMLPENFNNDWLVSGNNPFALQNSFAELATGYSDMFTYIPAVSTGTTCEFTIDSSMDVYVYSTTYVESISYTATTSDGTNIGSDSFSGLKHRQTCHFGNYPAGTKITVTTSESGISSLQLYAYGFNIDVFRNVYDSLNSQGLEITDYDDTYIRGTVDASNDGLLYTSIIYDKGWSAYVDGEEVETTSLQDALLMIPVTKGNHVIELKYSPEGLSKGILLSLFSVIILIIAILNERKIITFNKIINLIKKNNDSKDDKDEPELN